MNDYEENLEESILLEVTEQDHHQFKRLDHFLNNSLADLSRNFIKTLFLKGQITTENNSKLELKKMPPVGTTISILIPPPLPSSVEGENIPLDILFEDEHLIVINKQAGLVTHPAPGHPTGTLANAIVYHCPDLKGIGDERRPGIVHRLDKGTSGVMVIAKERKCHEGLVLLFSEHNIERRYQAIAMNVKMPSQGKLTSTIGRHPQHRQKMAANVPRGKNAITHYKVLEYFDKCSHLELKLETGRTHQIRVHLNTLLKAPILNDSLYSNPNDHLKRLGGAFHALLKDYPHPLLHAKVLGFTHPITKKELYFEAPAPNIFSNTLELARNKAL